MVGKIILILIVVFLGLAVVLPFILKVVGVRVAQSPFEKEQSQSAVFHLFDGKSPFAGGFAP